MKINVKNYGFTLIELMVSITILSIIMVSIFTIFYLTSNLNNKIDISRAMQENSKNILELISEDIRTKSLSGVNNDITNPPCELDKTKKYSTGTKLCVGENSYFLAIYDNISNNYFRVDESNCDGIKECVFVRNTHLGIEPISNSWVNFKYFRFYVSGGNGKEQKKVTITYEMIPSNKKGIHKNLIENYKINMQTTLTQNIYNIN